MSTRLEYVVPPDGGRVHPLYEAGLVGYPVDTAGSKKLLVATSFRLASWTRDAGADGLAMTASSHESIMLESLDAQQDQLLEDLELLNARIEGVIRDCLANSLRLDESASAC